MGGDGDLMSHVAYVLHEQCHELGNLDVLSIRILHYIWTPSLTYTTKNCDIEKREGSLAEAGKADSLR